MSAADNIVLNTNELSVGYNQKVILSHINVSLKQGEMVCFMGENGSGKSTLLRTITRLQPSLHGEICIQNQPVTLYKSHQLATKMSVVLTDRLNVGMLSVYELIAMGRYPYLSWDIRLNQDDKLHIERAIAATNTKSLIDLKVHTLSDGQLQKVMIARALAQDSPIMILDEPTAHLDLNNRVEVMRLLHELTRATGKAVLMATHELDLALQMADRLWLVDKNKSITSGIPEDLVLSGTLDRVFALKGYDLKTGKISHSYQGKASIQLIGEGFTFLWTKNALEREGYKVVNDSADMIINIIDFDGSFEWQLEPGLQVAHSIEQLLIVLKKTTITDRKS